MHEVSWEKLSEATGNAPRSDHEVAIHEPNTNRGASTLTSDAEEIESVELDVGDTLTMSPMRKEWM